MKLSEGGFSLNLMIEIGTLRPSKAKKDLDNVGFEPAYTKAYRLFYSSFIQVSNDKIIVPIIYSQPKFPISMKASKFIRKLL